MYVDAKWPSDPLLKLVGAYTPDLIMLPMNWAAAAAWPFQTVYDLAAKSRVGLRFNCKNLPSKCASLRFTCNRQWLRPAIATFLIRPSSARISRVVNLPGSSRLWTKRGSSRTKAFACSMLTAPTPRLRNSEARTISEATERLRKTCSSVFCCASSTSRKFVDWISRIPTLSSHLLAPILPLSFFGKHGLAFFLAGSASEFGLFHGVSVRDIHAGPFS